MGDQLSGLQEKDKACDENHAEGDPLDGVEKTQVGIGLAEEGKKKLNGACGGECQGDDVAGVAAATELAEEDCRQDGCGDCGVEWDGMERGAVGWDAHAPGEGGRKTGVSAFSEMTEGEDGPDEGRAWGPGVQSVEEREFAEAKISSGRDECEKDADGGERRQHEDEKGVGEEALGVGDDEKQAGEGKGGEQGEEAGVPESVGVEADEGCGAETEAEGGHKPHSGENAEGGKQEMAGVEKIGMHSVQCFRFRELLSAGCYADGG
jgi:hypothetical protein